MPIDYFLRYGKECTKQRSLLITSSHWINNMCRNQPLTIRNHVLIDRKNMAQLVLYDEGWWAATSFMQDVSIQEHINLSHNTSKLLVQTALLFASNQNDLHAIVISIAYECLVQQQSLYQLPVSIMTLACINAVCSCPNTHNQWE